MTVITGKNITIIKRIDSGYKSTKKTGYVGYMRGGTWVYKTVSGYDGRRSPSMTRTLGRKMFSERFEKGWTNALWSLTNMPWGITYISGRLTDYYTTAGVQLVTQVLRSRARSISCHHIERFKAWTRGSKIYVRATGRPCSLNEVAFYMKRSAKEFHAYISRQRNRSFSFQEKVLRGGKLVYSWRSGGK